jgi:hypothetical protein
MNKVITSVCVTKSCHREYFLHFQLLVRGIFKFMAIEMYGTIISTCEKLQSAVKLHNAWLNHFTRQAKIVRDIDSVNLFILF